MTSVFSEDSYEQALIALYKELGYEYLYGPEIERDLKEPLLLDKALDSLQRINPLLPLSAIEETIKKLRNIEGATLVETNFRFTLLMQNGVEITYINQKKEYKTDIVKLIDFEHPELNTFSVVNQYTMQEYCTSYIK